ncbi:DUF5009 domain-containing protein [Roseateles violae]|uniref:DUF5009 domain-containing protein n=1 Tax=Roseateles violae TaxID=3058042 RepID=A0ABT8DVJ8_9BURK|nr:DUF5009 domain-containing protein [Pelomonas sp. PFR6]MDN3920324.1 DUF5009 domain-containing protein [Pelomonas sp. PFR6]
MTPPRDPALDALRGLAILGMVLSGSLAFGDALPGWMFHAQQPPPLHRFEPTRAGISWVDLVFPFFLFSMGAAMPLAMRKLKGNLEALVAIGRRFALLLFFALFTQHMKPANLQSLAPWAALTLPLLAFGLLSLMLGPARPKIKAAAWCGSALLLALLPFQRGAGFELGRSDIILLVLADMALFGGLLYWFTRDRPLLRIALLPLLAAVLLGRQVSGSWNAALAGFTPAAWAYQFYYLKYLFILVPGMFAGEWLIGTARCEAAPRWPAAVALTLIVTNLSLLYAREPGWNLLASLALTGLLLWCASALDPLGQRCVQAGGYLLLLGLALEALEGGIRKDSSTFSYYAVGSGLAFFALLALRGLPAALTRWLAIHGRNPLLAYVAGALVVLPLLHLSGLHAPWSALNSGWLQGLAKGLLFTAAVSALTLAFTRRAWVWKA